MHAQCHLIIQNQPLNLNPLNFYLSQSKAQGEILQSMHSALCPSALVCKFGEYIYKCQ